MNKSTSDSDILTNLALDLKSEDASVWEDSVVSDMCRSDPVAELVFESERRLISDFESESDSEERLELWVDNCQLSFFLISEYC